MKQVLVVCVALAACVLGQGAWGQCGEWERIGVQPITGSPTPQMVEWDADGTGPIESLLVVGGHSSVGDGGVLGAWDGTRWSDLHLAGSQVSSTVNALCVYQGELVVHNNDLHRFEALDGAGVWRTLGNVGGMMRSIASEGADLWVRASSLTVDGQYFANGLAHYDGEQWRAVPGVFSVAGALPSSIAAWNHMLVVAGTFDSIDGQPMSGVAAFDGSTWHSMPWPQPNTPRIGVFDGALYGVGSDVRRWNGEAWEVVGPDSAPTWYNNPGTPHFTRLGIVIVSPSFHEVWRYDGIGWTMEPTWARWRPSKLVAWRNSFAGSFPLQDGYSSALAAQTDGVWRPLGDAPVEPVTALCGYAGMLAVGGTIAAGGMNIGGVATFDGAAWHALGAGIPDFTHGDAIRALVEYDGALWAGGSVHVPWSGGQMERRTGLWKWNGQTWQQAPGDWSLVDRLVVHQGQLFAAGSRSTAGAQIARLDGASWSPIAAAAASSLVSDGSRLYAAGNFSSIGGVQADGLAAWDGEAWVAMPRPPSVNVLGVYGGRLVAARYSGMFDILDGDEWHAVAPPAFGGDGPGAFAEFHGDLIVGCSTLYRWSPAEGARHIGRDELSGGVSGTPQDMALAVVGDSLFVGGQWTHNFGQTRAHLARWIDTPLCDCDSLDFNHNSAVTLMDITDFLSVFQGGVCVSIGYGCNDDIDFNNDGLFPDTLDIQAFLSVFSGGECVQ
ncbi:MAG TPA: hypothetical protein VHN77_07010 [Phycisphaerales bacterium]|nr:hypothetical protein [Phycisphaerales bacterium]